MGQRSKAHGTTLIEVYPHIVFSTKHRANIIHPEIEAELHRYIAGIVTNLDSPCIAVSGTEDHVHTLVSLGTTMAISNLIREVKKGSTSWLKRPRRSRRTSAGRTDTEGSPWGDRSCPPCGVTSRHHLRMSNDVEFVALLDEHGVAYDARYLWG